MEVNDRFLTLLTPEGEFLKAPNQKRNYQIGQEISFVPVKKESFFNGWSKVLHKKTAGILVAASLLLLFTFIPSRVDNEVYAYMSIDGESSIELAVNKDLEVINVIAYNESGKEVIADINWKNEQVDKVSSEILSSIENQEVNTETKEIVVGTVFAGTQINKTDEKLHQVIDSLKKEAEVEIADVQATAEERKAAKEQGVSVGKYKSQQAREKVKEKKEDHLKQEETSVETPAPSVTEPNNNTTNIPATNNNGNGNANPNAQKDELNQQQNSGNGNSNQNNPGQQKNEIKKNEKNISSGKKEEKLNNGNKEEKPRK
nr:anti-sigma factor domain-containing protein [Robertmurraya korlensis]